MSEDESNKQKSKEEEEKTKPNKIFVTNLDGEATLPKLEQDLRQMFGKYGELQSLVAKKSYNGEYSFAFIQYKEGVDATQAVRNLNQQYVGVRKMRVEFQENSRRRKGNGDGCYLCGKVGHFARECRTNNNNKDRRYQQRSKSSERHKSKKRRYESDSSDESRSPKKKKQKKKSSKSHKKSKKHRKSRDSSSESN